MKHKALFAGAMALAACLARRGCRGAGVSGPSAQAGGAVSAGRLDGSRCAAARRRRRDAARATGRRRQQAGRGGLDRHRDRRQAAPDGYTLLLHTSVIATDPTFKKTLPYNVRRDLAPVTLAVNGPYLLVVNPTLPVKNVAELIAYAKANPGKLNFGSAGQGSSGHLIGELFKMSAGIDMVHVPYKGGGPSITGLMAQRSAGAVRHDQRLGVARRERQAARARRHQHRALAGDAQRAHRQRKRAQGFLRRLLARHLRAGEDAARHRRQAVPDVSGVARQASRSGAS